MRARALLIVVGLAGGLTGCDSISGPEASGPPLTVNAQLAIHSGDQQRGFSGRSVSEFLVVRASDRFGRPVENVRVVWAVVEGPGHVSVKRQRTDAEGLAAASLFLGEGVGLRRVRAAAENGPEVIFTAQAR
ncbi:MAG: hypothetical protein ABR559_06320 [Gemmatimonadota bacterium]